MCKKSPTGLAATQSRIQQSSKHQSRLYLTYKNRSQTDLLSLQEEINLILAFSFKVLRWVFSINFNTICIIVLLRQYYKKL